MLKGKVNPVTGYEDTENRSIAVPFFFNSMLGGGVWSTPRPGPFTPGKKPGTHFTGGCVRKISLPPEFDPWIVQPGSTGGRT
jgi:hypothetical protein